MQRAARRRTAGGGAALAGAAALAAALAGACERAPTPGSDAESGEGRVLRVAAASDLQLALDELLREVAREHPDLDVRVSYGSSGTFFAQLVQGAPFDIYLSADLDYPRRLVERGVGAEVDLFEYALGHLVLWVPAGSALDPARGAAMLRDPALRRLAIANPAHAPYGRAAREALRALGVWEALEGRIVLGDNVAQTAQFVQSGAADAGIIALSLAHAPALAGAGRWWSIPEGTHAPLRQGGLILGAAKNRVDAERLRARIGSEEGRALLRRYGFVVPGG